MVQGAEDNGGQVQHGEKPGQCYLASGLKGQDCHGAKVEEVGHLGGILGTSGRERARLEGLVGDEVDGDQTCRDDDEDCLDGEGDDEDEPAARSGLF